MKNENEIAPINEDLNVPKYEVEEIKQKIYVIRGKQVMLESDVAKLFKYQTKDLNRNVRNNISRFPENYCFQLTEEEYNSLRSQFVTLKNYGRGQHRKYLPYVFTEQGLTMLSAVLHSDKAIRVSIGIMDAFIEMRKFLYENGQALQRISNIENKIVGIEYKMAEHEEKFEEIL